MKSLTPDEDTVLLGLLREIIIADGEYSDAERTQIDGIRDEMGPERFATAMAAAEAKYPSRTELKAHAKTITRPDAQKLIFERLKKVAESDGIDPKEEKPLAWLTAVWAAIR
ncbi:MAG: TerB family tellurite resistance protein [Myxococcota bacterium]